MASKVQTRCFSLNSCVPEPGFHPQQNGSLATMKDLFSFLMHYRLAFSLLLMLPYTSADKQTTDFKKKMYRFALVPIDSEVPYFHRARTGCEKAAAELGNIECVYANVSMYYQAEATNDLLEKGDIDGLAISVFNEGKMWSPIQRARERGIPVVTFDSDALKAARAAYIGTDNFAMGQRLGKMVKQLKPEGGSYLVIRFPQLMDNMLERLKGLREEMKDSGRFPWKEVVTSPVKGFSESKTAQSLLSAMRQVNPSLDTVISLFGLPTKTIPEWEKIFSEFPNVTFLMTGNSHTEIELFQDFLVDGLVSQNPSLMGYHSMHALLKLHQNESVEPFINTGISESVHLPLVFPPVSVDKHLLGQMKIVGYVMYAMIFVSATITIGWAYKNRKVRIVAMGQPGFMILVAAGVLIMGASIVPLTLDDSGADFSSFKGHIICMSPVWLFVSGYSLIFAALFAKLWRVVKVFRPREEPATGPSTAWKLQRITVTFKEALLPFAIVFSANSAFVICWTVVDPLGYVRKDMTGLDAWGRAVGSYGTCEGNDSTTTRSFLALLGVFNLGTVFLAIYQAFKAREIHMEFTESIFVGLTVATVQLLLLAVFGILTTVSMPEVAQIFAFVSVFVVSMTTLSLIFIPKFLRFRDYQKKPKSEQDSIVFDAIQASAHATASQS